jgi:hypothetical protein
MIDRRTFVAAAALAVVAPIPDLLTRPCTLPAIGASRVAFLIDGWSVQTHEEAADQMWIKIDRGWRTSWR